MTPVSRPLPYVMIAATALLAMLFYVQNHQWDLDRHNQAAQNIILLKQLDTRLNEETLKASALQLSNYDSIVEIMSDMQDVGARLHNTEEGLYGLINPNIDKGLNTFQSLMLKNSIWWKASNRAWPWCAIPSTIFRWRSIASPKGVSTRPLWRCSA